MTGAARPGVGNTAPGEQPVEPSTISGQRSVGRTTTMHAAVITSPGTIELQEQPCPAPGTGQLLLRLEGCGVCASNLPVWQGRDWFAYPQEPGAPGHEGWGHVAAVGHGVTGVHEGDRVAALSYHAYADHDIVDANAVIPIPAVVDGLPMPGEPLGCAVNIARRASIERGHTVAIIGIGFLGALLTSLAVEAGAHVIAISRRADALEVARQFGAQQTVIMDDHQRIIEEVKRLTSGRWCERVIEATGAQWPLDLAGELTAERGRLVIAGFHQDGPRQVNMQLWNWRGIDVVNAHERDPKIYVEGIREAIQLVADGRLDPRPLYTHQFSLARLDDAFNAATQRSPGFMKALVTVS